MMLGHAVVATDRKGCLSVLAGVSRSAHMQHKGHRHAGNPLPEALISKQGLVGGHHQQLRVIVLLDILQVAGLTCQHACRSGHAAGAGVEQDKLVQGPCMLMLQSGRSCQS